MEKEKMPPIREVTITNPIKPFVPHPVYVNDVDVVGCEFFSPIDSWGRVNACSQRFTKQCECANNPNCLYKQLKREKEENIALRMRIKNMENELICNFSLEQDKVNFSESAVTFLGKSPNYWLKLEREYDSLVKSYLNFQEVLSEKLDSMNRKIKEVLNG